MRCVVFASTLVETQHHARIDWDFILALLCLLWALNRASLALDRSSGVTRSQNRRYSRIAKCADQSESWTRFMSMVELVNHTSNAIFKHTVGYSKSSYKFLYYHTKIFHYTVIIAPGQGFKAVNRPEYDGVAWDVGCLCCHEFPGNPCFNSVTSDWSMVRHTPKID